MMVGSQQQDLVASAADDKVEIVQDVASQDAQVRGCNIGESSEGTCDTNWGAVIAKELDYGRKFHESALPTDPL